VLQRRRHDIGELVADANQVLATLCDDYEIIVVNDGSRDASADVLRGLESRFHHLRVITHPTNRGYGGALRSGYAAATKDLVAYTDGDGQYDIKELPLLLLALSPDVDFVNGVKMNRQDPAYRVFVGNLHKFLARWFLWLPVSDVDCDFRLVRREVISRFRLRFDSGAICAEIVKHAEWAGARFREVDVHHYQRRTGSSQFFKLTKILLTYVDYAILLASRLRPRRLAVKR
jgi:glycosyltransferase involved in cell wall biosynthesis